MSDASNPLVLKVDGSIARLTLNRPQKRNALNDELIEALKTTVVECSKAEGVRAIVLSGAGSDFCSGADLSALQKISGATVTENVADARSLLDLFLLFRKIEVPIIAAVHGRALAGGCGLATACDIVLASSSARFGYPEVKIGFVPAMVTAILRRNVSEKQAFELLTRGQEVSAQQASDIGLVNEVFSDESFTDDVTAYLERYSATSKSAVALTKSLLYQIDSLAFHEALEIGADVNVVARMTEDCQKGIAKFLKRN